MTQYSVQVRERMFLKGNRFWTFVKNMGTNIGKKIKKT